MKKLQILGTGCTKCRLLGDRTVEAAKELGLGYELEKVTDLGEITKFNVMMTPALVVDGTIKCSGRVPSLDELKAMLS